MVEIMNKTSGEVDQQGICLIEINIICPPIDVICPEIDVNCSPPPEPDPPSCPDFGDICGIYKFWPFDDLPRPLSMP